MTRVSSLVFIDLETSGMPKEEHNKTKITEISMIAVKRSHLLETRSGATPRVQHKVTLCLNPRRLIADDGTKVTGLSNDLLEYEPHFDINVYNILNTFLKLLTPPVCLIAHNGLSFDFPILKNHLEKLKVSFPDDLLCADSFDGFYNVLKDSKIYNHIHEINNDKIGAPNTEISDDCVTAQLAMKAINETTPKSNKIKVHINPASKARRRLPWGDSPKPKESYKLKDIYERVLNKAAVDAHRAENDCMFTLEISVALSKGFVSWVDENCVKFSNIEAMTVGVPLK